MSDQNNFFGGFFAGAVLGGLVGGLLGAALNSRREDELSLEGQSSQPLRDSLETEAGMEMARQTLEDKINQLNLAIDGVRKQLGEVDEPKSEQEVS